MGDSRAYLLRDGVLEQVTTDHSLVAELVESGVLTPEEAERHPQRSAITKASEPSRPSRPTCSPVTRFPAISSSSARTASRTCSRRSDIASAIEGAERDPEAAGDALVAAANARGGEDNITVVLFEIVDDDAPEPHADQQPGIEDTAVPAVDETGSAGAAEPTAAEPPGDPEPEPIRHGAGAGGRIAALALIVSVLAIALLVLYLAVR